jgi:hypothetical protein
MPGAFLYDNVAKGAVLISAQANVPSMPLANLQDAQPRRRARLNAASATIDVDLLAALPVDCVALISTTLGAGATVRARIGSDAALVEAVPVVDLDFMTGDLNTRVTLSRASSAWYFDSTGMLVEATNNIPRFDHDPVTLARRGLLMEGARTNGALRSRDLTSDVWVKTNITAARDVVGLDGAANTASRITATASNGTVLQSITGTSASRVTSFYVRRISGAGLVEITQNNGTTWTAIADTAAWQRFVIPAATMANPTIGLRLATAGDVVAMDLAQCEVGTFATSPIITEASAVTRASETGTMAFPVPAEFSLFAELITVDRLSGVGGSTNQFVAVDDGGNNNMFSLSQRTTSSPTSVLSVAVSGISTYLTNQPLTLGALHRHVGSYAAGTVAYSANGGALATQSGLMLPALNRLRFTSVGGSGANAVTYLRRVRLYGTRLTNAQLVALSGTGSSMVAAEVTGDTGIVAAEAEDANQGNVILTLPAPVVGRYLRIDLTDGAAAFMDIGLLVAGHLWRLQRGTGYGIREGRVMLDRRDRNPFTGAEFPVPAIVNPRMAAFTLPALSVAEARNQHRDLLRRLGAAGDALWIAELGDSLAERNRRAIWGAMNAPGDEASASRDSFPFTARAVRMVERL